jgi:hypothetical protein
LRHFGDYSIQLFLYGIKVDCREVSSDFPDFLCQDVQIITRVIFLDVLEVRGNGSGLLCQDVKVFMLLGCKPWAVEKMVGPQDAISREGVRDRKLWRWDRIYAFLNDLDFPDLGPFEPIFYSAEEAGRILRVGRHVAVRLLGEHHAETSVTLGTQRLWNQEGVYDVLSKIESGQVKAHKLTRWRGVKPSVRFCNPRHVHAIGG